MITDGQSLKGATINGNKIETYDDGYGPLFIHRDSMGISGIVRAQTWEDAYGICEDEFFPEADETIEEIKKEYDFRTMHVKIIRTPDGTEREDDPDDYPFGETGCSFVRWDKIKTPEENSFSENPMFQESFGFRPSGPRAGKWENGEPKDPIGHGIYSKDLNGDSLDILTKKLAAELNITLEIENEE